MVWPFRAKCPLDVDDKVRVERHLAGLAVEFGVDRLLIGDDVFTACTRVFPDGAVGSDTEATLSAICAQMGFDEKRFALTSEPPAESETPVAHGGWEVDGDGRYVIRTRDLQTGGAELQVAVLARIVGCALLIERGSFDPQNSDDLQQAELAATAMGFGPMIANMTVATVDVGFSEGWPRWMVRYGHLPSHVTGYALAVLCWLGGANEASSRPSLRSDAANAYRRGMRYLQQTNDCLIQREQWGRSIENRSLSVLECELSSEYEGRRLAAIRELAEHRDIEARTVEAVVAMLRDKNAIIRANAAITLGRWGADARSALPELIRSIGSERDGNASVKEASAAGLIGAAAVVSSSEREELWHALVELKERAASRSVRDAALDALTRLDVDARLVRSELAKSIRDAIADADDHRLRMLLACVQRIESDVDRFLNENFSDRDPELVASAQRVLRETPRRKGTYSGFPDSTRGSVITDSRWL